MTIQYRSGGLTEVKVRIQAGVTVAIGDLMKTAGNYATKFGGADTATTFHDVFIGPLKAGRQNGLQTEDRDGLCWTDGEFEATLDVAAVQEWPVGTPVSAFAAQTVKVGGVVVGDQIGELARRVNAGDTTCLFRLESVVMGGGAAAPA